MRCPSCGTENEPDSRFCGECGTRLGPTLPPTQKIPPNAPANAPIPRNVSTPQGAQAVVPRNVSAQPLAGQPAPRLSPPLVAPPSPLPAPAPAFVQQPPRASSPYSSPPSVSSAPPPEDPIDLQTTKKRNSKPSTGARPVQDSLPQLGSRRRLGLILLVLLIDVGLAIAGAVMLAEGLATDDPPPRTSSETAAPKPAATLPAAATAPAAAPAPTPPAVTQPVSAPAPGSSSLTNAITDLPPTPEPEKPRHSRKKKSTGKPGSGSAPVDPYEGTDPPPSPPPPPP